MKHLFYLASSLFILSACQSPPACSTVSGTYSGTSVMGSSSGTCSVQIKADCSAVLNYDHGDFGSATENGTLEKTGDGFQFISASGGGKYEVKVNGSELALEGYNWHCEMEKE
jgi:hypothetical protein